MSFAHGASFLQGAILIACGMAWYDTFGFVDWTMTSSLATVSNLYSLWTAIMDATDLFYETKETVTHRALCWVDNVQHIVLKGQGLDSVS